MDDLPEGSKSKIEKRKIERNKRRRERYKQRRMDDLAEEFKYTIEKQRIEQNKRRRELYKQRREQYIKVAQDKRSQETTTHEQTTGQNNDTTASNTSIKPILMINRNASSTKAFEEVSTRMRNRIQSRKKQFAETTSILNIGRVEKECVHCGAMMWEHERTKQGDSNTSSFSLCCSHGKVKLPYLEETPPELKRLLDGTDELSRSFQKNYRMYNTAFSFTSTGGEIDNRYNHGGGPFVYRIFGDYYHQIGSLYPVDGENPVYSQIYMFDNQQEIESRINFPYNDDILDVRIIETLTEMMERENEVVKMFHDARQRFSSVDCTPSNLRLVANRETDGRETSKPTNAHEFAALIVDDNLADSRDIVV
ncbi:hypothetical protein POM88_027128 [Heracleum sosnowskyi]|uniref:Uncharacterized protein n=1 Tax=Heracleum sosnowskyi TaxID=360622 RepID=A0AAD8I8D9_9APIA|nr:hypothetical protein POM88_027128 [Heracleum sosnowskyi]